MCSNQSCNYLRSSYTTMFSQKHLNYMLREGDPDTWAKQNLLNLSVHVSSDKVRNQWEVSKSPHKKKGCLCLARTHKHPVWWQGKCDEFMKQIWDLRLLWIYVLTSVCARNVCVKGVFSVTHFSTHIWHFACEGNSLHVFSMNRRHSKEHTHTHLHSFSQTYLKDKQINHPQRFYFVQW